PGRVELLPEDERAWLTGLAHMLCSVHEHAAPGFAWSYRSWVQPLNVAVPVDALDTRLWEAAVAAYAAWRSAAVDRTFLHRDYHALNALFAGRGRSLRVVGVVDWVNACVGPAASDV